MPAGFILIFIVFVAIMIIGGIFSHRRQKERQAALALLANDLGWSFDHARNHAHDSQFRQFSLFNTGGSRFGYNTLRGTLSVNNSRWVTQMGDYHYVTKSGTGKNRSTTTHRFSYLIVLMPYALVPDLKIRREGLFDRIGSFIGFDDIDFESAEFSDRFHVKSSDKRFAYDIIHPRMMEFLLADEPPTLEIRGNHCFIHTRQSYWTPEEFRTQIVWLQTFYELWPQHITSTLSN